MSSIIRDTDSRRDYSTSYHEWLHEQSRQGLPSDIASQVCTITQSILRRYRKAARDHGHLDPFLREADEAFADEMATAYGVCRVPVPLMIPLSTLCFLERLIATHLAGTLTIEGSLPSCKGSPEEWV